VPRTRRRIAAALLLMTALVFSDRLARVEPQLLLRPDAVRGSVGPWRYTLAEAQREPPEVMALEVPMKEFRLRFCDSCDLEIRQAMLKVNRPRSARASGMAFMGQRWERTAEIPLPDSVTADSELWLTVIGKDGMVHQAAMRMDQVSPATVAWFARQRSSNASH
jgi:hypothetical protein